jgi:hypothetical protein
MASGLGFVLANFFDDPFFGPFALAPLVFVAFGGIGFLVVLRLARKYTRAEQAYRARRAEVLRQAEAAGISMSTGESP